MYDAAAKPAGKNEDDSARAFEAFAAELALGHRAPARVAKVAAWIATTKTHKCGAAAGFDERVFMDADMAILATTPWREYERCVSRRRGRARRGVALLESHLEVTRLSRRRR